MLHNSRTLKGFTIRAKDGEIGKVDQLYFDDESWVVRYLIVETGGWLAGRFVLISPISVTGMDWDDRCFDVALTKSQVENSPDISTHRPISRQHEAQYMEYFGYPAYWGGLSLWGPGFYPGGLLPGVDAPPAPVPDDAARATTAPVDHSGDAHLRSTAEVTGYTVGAIDGDIGHVAGFLVDGQTWAIRYIEVATRNWWPGKKVLVAPRWIQRVSWEASSVLTALSRQKIQDAPEYTEEMGVNREYEAELHRHYGQPTYWVPSMASHVRAEVHGNQ